VNRGFTWQDETPQFFPAFAVRKETQSANLVITNLKLRKEKFVIARIRYIEVLISKENLALEIGDFEVVKSRKFLYSRLVSVRDLSVAIRKSSLLVLSIRAVHKRRHSPREGRESEGSVTICDVIIL
jgi:hypothetical protein